MHRSFKAINDVFRNVFVHDQTRKRRLADELGRTTYRCPCLGLLLTLLRSFYMTTDFKWGRSILTQLSDTLIVHDFHNFTDTFFGPTVINLSLRSLIASWIL